MVGKIPVALRALFAMYPYQMTRRRLACGRHCRYLVGTTVSGRQPVASAPLVGVLQVVALCSCPVAPPAAKHAEINTAKGG